MKANVIKRDSNNMNDISQANTTLCDIKVNNSGLSVLDDQCLMQNQSCLTVKFA